MYICICKHNWPLTGLDSLSVRAWERERESLRERERERESGRERGRGRERERERERVLALPLTARELGGFSAYMYVKESASSTLESWGEWTHCSPLKALVDKSLSIQGSAHFSCLELDRLKSLPMWNSVHASFLQAKKEGITLSEREREHMLCRECTLLPKWGGVTAFTYMYVRENAHFTVESYWGKVTVRVWEHQL